MRTGETTSFPNGIKQTVIGRYASAPKRSQLLNLTTNTEGLDLAQLAAFRQKIDASDTPILFLDDFSFLPVIRSAEISESAAGVYLEGEGLAIVRRNLGLEALNGAAFATSQAAHEAFHTKHPKAPLQVRHGFDTTFPQPSYSCLQEEGMAELMRGLFNLENSLVGQFTQGASNYEAARRSRIPLKYMFKIDDGPTTEPFLTYPPSAIPATIFEILARHESTILPLILTSRKDPKAAQALAATMNSMMKGLHSAMVYAEPEAASAILDVVEERFGGL